MNTVMIDTRVPLSLKKQDEYSNITLDGLRYKEYTNQKITYQLKRLGYEAGDIQRVLTQCCNFEGRLSAGMKTSAEQNTIDYLSTADNTCTMDQMREIEGAYPLTQILSREQLDTSMHYTVTEPEYVKNVGKLYNESNLEEIKSYYLVHTLVELMPLLDRESYDKYTEIEALINGNTTKEKSDPDMDQDESGNANQSEADKETEILLDGFIGVYLAEPMDEIYIAQYCKAEDKADIEWLIDDAIAYYREMLQGEDWLSEETRNKAVEKLDNLTIRAVYPDTVTDYTGLQFAQGGSLADAVAATKRFKSTQMKNKVNQAINSSEWDMNEMSTTVSNAYYKPLDNSINILAGILADGFFYNREATHEERLTRIGTIIGHEITHAFDTQGSQFDKDGRAVNWWTNDDTTAFMARTTKLTQFYGALTPYPGALSYGASVSGEAIADMGGVKCMLGLASKKADFDYQVFFKAYGELWRQKNTYAVEEAIAEDVHPLAFLRVNVTLQQFDAFNEAFGIRSGDGMYVAPENRIMVW
ncbi:M13 family metallopeptidase [Eubacterium aggregans]|uniref:M13 family metallopeptidase n=2 Tax=Eubacterium aggregans TaxID=81409 RepID=UPI003F308A42